MALHHHLLLLLLLLLHLPPPLSTTTTTLPDCPSTCGIITVPFPFALSPTCPHAPSFLLTCNQTSDPPNLFYVDTNIQITKISPDTVTIAGWIGQDCYDETPSLTYNAMTDITDTPFTFSYLRNKFTAIGCDAVSLVSPLTGSFFTTGCMALCRDSQSVVSGSCAGIGCCQTAIPKGLKRFYIVLRTLDGHNRTKSFSPCSYAFLVDVEEYVFSVTDFYDFRYRSRVPVVLDWAVGNRSCAETRKDGDLLCGGNSECVESTNGPGYRCRCVDGYDGNPYLSDGCQDINECEDPVNNPCVDICTNTPGSYKCYCSQDARGDGHKNGSGCTSTNKTFPLVKVILGSGSGMLFLALTTTLSYWALKKRRLFLLKDKFFKQNGGLLLQQQISSHDGAVEMAKIFTSEQLSKATHNYSPNQILGHGGSGTVYKGTLPDNRTVAIKKSKLVDETQIEPFINELVILSKVNHRHVVKIIGFCLETQIPLLVYEYVPNNTLFHHLHHPTRYSSLSWESRLRIATETAGALAYLHSATTRPIIHRDVKSANILLNENYTAKVSDFGASRLVPLGKVELNTLVMGTLGYLDPQYFQTGVLTEKSDVYSFGVVLAELMTGERPVMEGRGLAEERMLAKYFIRAIEGGGLDGVLEERVVREGRREEVEMVAEVAGRCLRITGEERPTMREVSEEIERAMRGGREHPWGEEQENEETGTLLGDLRGLVGLSGSSSSNL